VNKQDIAFCSLLNEIALGKSEVTDPVEVDTLEKLINFDYAQAVPDVSTQQLVYSNVRMTMMGRAFLRERHAAAHPAR